MHIIGKIARSKITIVICITAIIIWFFAPNREIKLSCQIIGTICLELWAAECTAKALRDKGSSDKPALLLFAVLFIPTVVILALGVLQ